MYHDRIEALNIDDLAEICGGRFRLTVLVGKRLREINAGAPLLLEPKPGERLIETVCREIETHRIWLESPTEVEAPVSEVEEDIGELLDM